MADKLTQQIIESLARAAAEPGGLPLYSSKADAGLFPNTASAKLAAQKCLADDLIRATGTEARGKSPRDLYSLTDKGWEFLLAAVNPKQVLEDFVRVLEARQGEVGELLATARRMADSLQGLKEAVARVLPAVTQSRIERPVPGGAEGPNPLAPFPEKEGGVRELACFRPSPFGGGAASEASGVGSEKPEEPTPQPPPCREGEKEMLTESESMPAPPMPFSPLPAGRGAGGVGSSAFSDPTTPDLAVVVHETAGVALLDGPAAPDLAPAILGHLAEHSGLTDCTLPELFRALAVLSPALSIGEFHDCLRTLYADGALSLHSWTAPLYAMPEPQYALLVGHGVAYFASLRG